MNVTVIGNGGWGTALALICHANGHAVTVWGPFEDEIESIRQDRENRRYLPGVPLPAELKWTASHTESVARADAVILAVPTKYFSTVMQGFAGLMPASLPVVSVAKGLERGTHRRMSQVADDVLRMDGIAALSGPSHAEEAARGIPTAVTVASQTDQTALFFQKLLANSRFRVYTSRDIIGVELGGALKNVIAVAVGISDGLGFGDNTRAALITRGLAEISRIGIALGARPETFAGLSGIGDLIVTCTSRLSRNRHVGERLGRGETLTEIMDGMQQAAEGIWNCAAAHELAAEKNIYAPITDEVYAVVHQGKSPSAAVRSLLERPAKPEIPD